MIDIKLIEKLSKSKDSDVLKLVEQVKIILENPHYEALVSVLTQKNNWLKQYQKKKIDLFDADQKPVFEMAHKFFQELKPYIDLEDFLRTKLAPKQQEQAQEASSAYERSLQRNGLVNAD